MSFTCYFCGCHQGSRVKPQKVVLEKRLIITDIVQKEDPVTHLVTAYSKGKEGTVKEELACSVCANKPHYPKIVEFRDESKVPVLSEVKI